MALQGYLSINIPSFCITVCLYHFLFVVRLYDVNTFQCFVGRNPNDQHTGPITGVSMLVVAQSGLTLPLAIVAICY